MEITDYTELQNMVREFVPYSKFWNTVHGWIEGSEKWIYDPFETVDAIQC